MQKFKDEVTASKKLDEERAEENKKGMQIKMKEDIIADSKDQREKYELA
jgi:hypothetical protein